jgi:hypothetical protein
VQLDSHHLLNSACNHSAYDHQEGDEMEGRKSTSVPSLAKIEGSSITNNEDLQLVDNLHR